MKLKREQVEKIAKLARLELAAKEKEKFQKELSAILDYVEQLKEVKVDGIQPTHQVTGLENIWREDQVFACDVKTRDEIIDNFPDKKDDLLKVPPVFE